MGFAHGFNINQPSLVGVVDPVEVSHIAMEEDPNVEVKFISDIMEDTVQYKLRVKATQTSIISSTAPRKKRTWNVSTKHSWHARTQE